MANSLTPSSSKSDSSFATHYLPDWYRKGSCLADHVDTWIEQSDESEVKYEEHIRGQSGVRERREGWTKIKSQSDAIERRDKNQIVTVERRESWSKGKDDALGKVTRRGSYDSETGESWTKGKIDFSVRAKGHTRGLSEGAEVCHARMRCHAEPTTSHQGSHGHNEDEPIPTTSHQQSHQGSYDHYEVPLPTTSHQRSYGHYEDVPIPITNHQRSRSRCHGHYEDVPIPSTSHQRSHHESYGQSEDMPNPAPLTTDVVWEWQDYEEQDWWWMTGQGGSPGSSCHNLSQDDDMISLASLSRHASHHDEDRGREHHHESWEDLGCATLRRALSSLTLRLHHAEKERPVQRILRQPRRRQTTRGLSGLPIEAANKWTATTALDG